MYLLICCFCHLFIYLFCCCGSVTGKLIHSLVIHIINYSHLQSFVVLLSNTFKLLSLFLSELSEQCERIWKKANIVSCRSVHIQWKSQYNKSLTITIIKVDQNLLNCLMLHFCMMPNCHSE